MPFALMGQSSNVRQVVIGNNVLFYRGQTPLDPGASGGNLGDTVLTSSDQTDMRNSAWWLANTSYEIRDSINLGGVTVTLPVNVTLKFNGGLLASGTVTGNHASFVNLAQRKIFDTTLVCAGTWQTTTITPQDYGAITVDTNTVYSHDCSPAFRACLKSIFDVRVPGGFYYIKRTIYALYPKTVTCSKGLIENIDHYTTFNYKPDQVRLFSDQNIDYVVISTPRFYWFGGTFDSRNVAHHTKCFFRYDYNGIAGASYRAMWGGSLDFNAIGNRDALKTDQAGTTAVWFNGSASTTNNGYATEISISGYWSWLGMGIKIDPDDWVTHGTWTNHINTDISMDGVRVGWYMEANALANIKGFIQARGIFSAATKYTVAAYLGAVTYQNLIDIKFWDFYSELEGEYYKACNGLQDNGKHNNLSEGMIYSLSQANVGNTNAYTKKELYSYGNGGTRTQLTEHGALRPNPVNILMIGQSFFDSYLGYPIWWNGDSWIKYDGTPAPSIHDYGVYLTDLLSAYYKFDETEGTTLADATGNGNTATVSGGVTINQTGILGKAVLFDGTDGCLTIPLAAGLTFPAVDYSISAWINFTGTGNGSIVGGTGNRDPYFSIRESDLKLYWGIQGYAGPQYSDSSITKSEWHHVVVVHDSIRVDTSVNYFYIDGRYAGVKNYPYDDYSTSASNIIRIGLGDGVYYKGLMDELAIYKRKLSVEEILLLYYFGTPRPYSTFGSYDW